MKAKLSLFHLSHKVRDVVVDHFPLLIGRSPDADITLADRWVSRRHCQIEASDGMLVVRDLDSTHGTLVNDATITQADLLPGDRLSVGLTTIVASYETGVTVDHSASDAETACES